MDFSITSKILLSEPITCVELTCTLQFNSWDVAVKEPKIISDKKSIIWAIFFIKRIIFYDWSKDMILLKTSVATNDLDFNS